MNDATSLGTILPQFFPAHWLETADIVFSDFPSRIRIGYVHRVEGAYTYLMKEEFAELGVSVEQLHTAALRNLQELPGAAIKLAKHPAGPEGFIAAEEDNFAAARILLPNVREKLSDFLGVEFLVGIPHRDFCLCWSVSQSAERQEKNAREVLEDCSNDDYALTPDILQFASGRFKVYREQNPA